MTPVSINNDRISEIIISVIEQFTNFVLQEIPYEFLENANDLDKCDEEDTAKIISLYDNDKLNDEEVESTFSVLEILEDKKHYSYINIIENLVHENFWQCDVLDQYTQEQLDDIYNMSCIVNKYYYGGGGFEFQRYIEISVSKKVYEYIKEKYNK
jgi:hypothetical protein